MRVFLFSIPCFPGKFAAKYKLIDRAKDRALFIILYIFIKMRKLRVSLDEDLWESLVTPCEMIA